MEELNQEASVMRETVLLIVEIVSRCKTVDEALEALNHVLERA